MPNKIKFKRYFSKQIQLFGVFWRCIFCSRDTDKLYGYWDGLKNGRNARKYRHNPDKIRAQLYCRQRQERRGTGYCAGRAQDAVDETGRK